MKENKLNFHTIKVSNATFAALQRIKAHYTEQGKRPYMDDVIAELAAKGAKNA